MTVTIYHNPNCGASRNTLAMIRQSGEEPVVIEYLKNLGAQAGIVAPLATEFDADQSATEAGRTQ